jgi:hypothetical protein
MNFGYLAVDSSYSTTSNHSQTLIHLSSDGKECAFTTSS